ncbi:MAG: uncharacterized protein JWP97_832 [Labilithrix sp.]|nr:uncharacterized protein [Labilithrix sp.]
MTGPPRPDSIARAGALPSWDPAQLACSPLFWPLERAIAQLLAAAGDDPHLPAPETIDRALGPLAGMRFERQVKPPRRRRAPRDPSSMYDARIAAGVVPTRHGSWHDLANALVWATFPSAKRALHARQHALVVPAAPGESARRPRELDTLALLDEGGLLVVTPVPLEDEPALAAAVGEGRATPVVFGHAVYEGLALGRELPVSSVVCLPGSAGPTLALADVDRALASVLADPARLRAPADLLRLRPTQPRKMG